VAWDLLDRRLPCGADDSAPNLIEDSSPPHGTNDAPSSSNGRPPGDAGPIPRSVEDGRSIAARKFPHPVLPTPSGWTFGSGPQYLQEVRQPTLGG
jgi:hypothetical protein